MKFNQQGLFFRFIFIFYFYTNKPTPRIYSDQAGRNEGQQETTVRRQMCVCVCFTQHLENTETTLHCSDSGGGGGGGGKEGGGVKIDQESQTHSARQQQPRGVEAIIKISQADRREEKKIMQRASRLHMRMKMPQNHQLTAPRPLPPHLLKERLHAAAYENMRVYK